MAAEGRRTRARIRCRGAVQGVGFRPTVHRLATELGLAGWIVNDPEGATTEVEGEDALVACFVDELPSRLPPLARLDGFEVDEVEPVGANAFVVELSHQGRRAGALVPPDAVLCADCRREMDNPADRRFHYPFATCTNCGPRFSLVHALPYDRRRTAMACFPLCAACEREYRDPTNRRFHAEPVCCPECGPRLWATDRDGTLLGEGERAVVAMRAALLEGAVVALKGLGGFQLACRADQKRPVARLRERKERPTKPFAIMVRDLETAERLVALTAADRALLASPRAPVVLAPRRAHHGLADGVAPGIEDLGVMLPTTPLHVELLRDPGVPPLVMTSGNASDEPICRTNREALERLAPIADRFLLHDRDVVRRIDDSVVRSTDDGPVVIRRARGWVPEPLTIPDAAGEPVLALGSYLQVTACLATGRQAFLSQHVGDLDSGPARAFLDEVVSGLLEFLEAVPAVIAADCHPDYPSTWLARRLAARHHARPVAIQHHLAHAAAVLAEHGAFPAPGEAALAIALDGTGWGPDGSAWGGEWLLLDGDLGWRRLARLEPLRLVGGERAVREPWRVAVAALACAGLGDQISRLPVAASVEPRLLAEVARLAGSASWPLASGAGRLFEACGALLGLTTRNSWEGEAAVRLEGLAARAPTEPGPWPEVEAGVGCGEHELPSIALLAAAARRTLAGEAPELVAAGFHATFCRLAGELSAGCARVTDSTTVAIGGGCLVNRLLRRGLARELHAAGLEPLLPSTVPPGDGGLAYGQAVLAAAALARDYELPVVPGGDW